MNLPSLPYERTFKEMVKAYQKYYGVFYHEMIRVSNVSLSNYIEKYVSIAFSLSKNSNKEDAFRAGVGILSLQEFGFREFSRLTAILDRILPQTDPEIVAFTSWVAGRLLHHPNTEQSKYINRLFYRIEGWINGKGRRERHIAAARMIMEISEHAGGSLVSFLPKIQQIATTLLTHPSFRVLNDTVGAIKSFTNAVIKYRRDDLSGYLDYFEKLCATLLSFNNPDQENAALLVLANIVVLCPNYFVSFYDDINDLIGPIYESSPIKVKCSCIILETALSKVDPNLFVTSTADNDYYNLNYIEQVKEVILDFPEEISDCLIKLVDFIPDYATEMMDDIIEIVKLLVENEIYDCAFNILLEYLKEEKSYFSPFDDKMFRDLIKAPMSIPFKEFFVYLMHNQECVPEIAPFLLCKRFTEELKEPNPKITLQLIGALPSNIFPTDNKLLPLIQNYSYSESSSVRKAVPRAIFTILDSKQIPKGEIVLQMMQLALSDTDQTVRCEILRSIGDNCIKELASPKALHLLRAFVNDDAASVRIDSLNLLTKVYPLNTMCVAGIVRQCFLDNFFILKNTTSIRQQSRVAMIFPYIISATGEMMKIYSSEFLEIFFRELSVPSASVKYTNFKEKNSAIRIKVGLVDSLVELAKFDKEKISENADRIIDVLCDCLVPTEERVLIIAVLKCLTVLLSPIASSVSIRSKCAEIFTACSTIIAETSSNKMKTAALQVIGAIGVIDVHQRGPPKTCQNPGNLDEDLKRAFFQPNRDVDNVVDETFLLQPQKQDIYYGSVIASILIEVLEDPTQSELYIDTCKALTQTIDPRKMLMLPALDQFVSILLELMEKANDETLEQYISVLIDVIHSSLNNIVPFITKITDFINRKFSPRLSFPLVKVVLALVLSTKDAFVPYAHTILPFLVDTLENCKISDKKTSVVIIETFAELAPYANDQLFLMVNQICDAIVSDFTIPDVRIAAIKALEKIATSCDLMPYMGVVIRSVKTSLFVIEDEETYKAALSLLITLVHYFSKAFLFEVAPILQRLKAEKKDTEELIKAVTEVEIGKVFTKPIKAAPAKPRKVEEADSFSISEEIIIAKIATPNFGESSHLEQWLLSVIRMLIMASPRKAIRACSKIANASEEITWKLFHVAFLCAWHKFSDYGRKIFTSAIKSILTASENYKKACHEVISLLVFMHRIGEPLNIQKSTIIDACIKYRCFAFALKLQEEMFESKSGEKSVITKLIDIFTELGQRENAIAIYNMCNISLGDSLSILAKIQCFDQCIEPYQNMYKKNRNNDRAFCGLIKSLYHTSQWKEVIKYYSRFEQVNGRVKYETSTYFAEAALHLGKWELLDDILEFSPSDSARCNIISALNGLHRHDFERVNKCIEHGFALIASKPVTFWAEHQKLDIEVILAAQRLVEIREMEEWITAKNKDIYTEIWEQRLKTTPSDFDIWFEIISNRTCITKIHDENLIRFFQLRSPTLGTSTHFNTFDILFPGHNFKEAPEIDRLCYIIAKRNSGQQKEALDLLRSIIPYTKGNLKYQCNYLYASWIVEDQDTLDANIAAYESLKVAAQYAGIKSDRRFSVDNCCCLPKRSSHRCTTYGDFQFSLPVYRKLNSDVMATDILRKWAYVAAELISSHTIKYKEYVTTAIECLTECIQRSPSFPDVVQLLNIFFENAERADIFEKTAPLIKMLPTKYLLQTSPQILVQLSHCNQEVSDLVHDIVLDLLLKHYHGLIFSIIVMQDSVSHCRKDQATTLMQEFTKAMPEEAREVKKIREGMLRAAVTRYDLMLEYLEIIKESIDVGNFEEAYSTMLIINEKISEVSCQLEATFNKKFAPFIEQMKSFAECFNPKAHLHVNNFTSWTCRFYNAVAAETANIEHIQLDTISEELCYKTHFRLAVPGTYKPDQEINRIEYFVQQLYVFASKQQPKSFVIKGEDGNLYQYLLKGHEDLRLDERIMQFFHLVNSISKKEHPNKPNTIQTMVVIPISVSNGLVQWVQGTDTLKSIVETYRSLKKVEPEVEFNLLREEYGNKKYDYMVPIQKMQILKRVFNEVPDTDIANFFWLKATNAEQWLKMTSTFATSTAVNSVIGYIIGLGDRHPSNILIDRSTGKAVHIDFGDSFEKAMTRDFLPEVVPFRLTRMIVKAMGVTGVDGMFKSTFTDYMGMLRENWRSLILVLAIFVHEPLVILSSDTCECTRKIPGSGFRKSMKEGIPRSDSQTDEIRRKVKKKLNGNDPSLSCKQMTIEEQTNALIKSATDEYKLASMYSGWCPFW